MFCSKILNRRQSFVKWKALSTTADFKLELQTSQYYKYKTLETGHSCPENNA
jgi:hypothetical protein